MENIEYKLFVTSFHTMELEGKQNVIVSVEFTYSGFTTVGGRRFSHGVTRSVPIYTKALDVDNFIEFNNVTKEIAEQWVLSTLSERQIEEIKDIIKSQINFDVNVTIKNPPWIQVTEGSAIQTELKIEKE